MTLAFSTGDPAGIGPHVSVRAAIEIAREGEDVILFGDAAQLEPLLAEGDPRISIVDVARVDPGRIARHAPDPTCGAAQLAVLDRAIDCVRAGHARALVTAPISKAAIVLAGHPGFVGHTEHLARGAGLADDEVTMMFLGPRLRLALVTTHLAVKDVPGALTIERVARATVHLGEALARVARDGAPSLAIAGLNPHAGEAGLFGDEEIRVLEPALARARGREPFASGRVTLAGIVPAESALRRAADGGLDGVVCMFHDQATIASKLLDWGAAVNVTWGLPFVRTSVDHGVAYDAAAAGKGDPEGMIAAARMARVLAGVRGPIPPT